MPRHVRSTGSIGPTCCSSSGTGVTRFVCPQPTFYHDVYTQNGWAIEKMVATNGEQMAEIPYTGRFVCPPEFSLYVLARRLSPAPLTYPTQTKYLRNPQLQ